MSARWPRFHRPGLAWVKRVEKAILSREPDETGPYMAITNAIEHHFEAGADRTTVRHLIDALAAHAASRGIEPSALGIDDSSDQILDRLQPRNARTR